MNYITTTESQNANTKRRFRKEARTRIYNALYGAQGFIATDPSTGKPIKRFEKRSNLPWADNHRVRPQGWEAAEAMDVILREWKRARFDHSRAARIETDLNNALLRSGHNAITIAERV